MLDTCSNCGAPRAEKKRFCRACGLDWMAEQGVHAVQPVTPVKQAAAVAKIGANAAAFLLAAVVAVAFISGAAELLQSDAADNATQEVVGELDDDRTPEPTTAARRTPAPTPDAGERAFKEFVEHVSPMSAVIVAGMENVAADATRLDIEALQTSSIDLWLALGEEVQWIGVHPPKPCYRELHSGYTDAITTLRHALDLISDGAINRDPDRLNQGAETMSTGNRLLNDATALIRPANRACRHS
jgi:hypothetical protein